MRLSLLQLPVPDHAGTDLPLAAGHLWNAWLRGRGALGPDTLPAWEYLPCPVPLMNHGGDQALLDWLVDARLDLVGFSLYLWNAERSAWLARELKRRLPQVRVLGGGPEVTRSRLPDWARSPASGSGPDAEGIAASPQFPGGSMTEAPGFDWLVAGPGEAAFAALLAAWPAGSGRENQAAPLPAPPALYRPRREAQAVGEKDPHGPHPWLDGSLAWPAPGPGASISLETVRGCPNRCHYCHYGKNAGRLLFLPEPQIAAIIGQCRERGIGDLYLMDPSFSQRPGLDGFLERLADWTQGGLAIHTELRLEDITPSRARALGRAGVRSVEAGLQSTNPQALAAVGRAWDRPRFEAGAAALADCGIRISTGIIVGLPHDTPATIARTVDYLAGLGLGGHAEAYPLAILPGTRLAAEAEALGMSRMKRPPWYLLESPWIDQAGIQDCLDYAAERWGHESVTPPPPLLSQARWFETAAELGAWLAATDASQRCLALGLAAGLVADRGAWPALERIGAEFRRREPHAELRISVDIDAPRLSLPALGAGLEALRGSFIQPDHLLERLRYYQDDAQGSWSCRLFVRSARADRALAWSGSAASGQAELVLDLARSPEAPALRRLILKHDWELLPFVRVGPDPDPELSLAYADHPELILA